MSSSYIRALLRVLAVQAKEGNAVMQLTHKNRTASTYVVSSMASDPDSITWRSRLSSTGMEKKTQFLTMEKESVTGSEELYA